MCISHILGEVQCFAFREAWGVARKAEQPLVFKKQKALHHGVGVFEIVTGFRILLGMNCTISKYNFIQYC
jgi:hypothetical protein